MSIFGKARGKPRKTPTGMVMDLSSRGYSQTEIIKILRKEGYSISQVDSALKEALRSGVAGERAEERARAAQRPVSRGIPGKEAKLPPSARARLPKKRPDMGELMKDFEEERPAEPEELPERELSDLGLPELPGERPRKKPAFREEAGREEIEEEEAPRPMRPADPFERELAPLPRFRGTPKERHEEKEAKIEELTERIVEEKWDEIKSKMDSISTILQDLDDKIKTLEQRLMRVQDEKKTEIDEIKEKIDDYQGSIDEVGVRMESVEKALKDSLGPMMESIRALSSAVKAIKK